MKISGCYAKRVTLALKRVLSEIATVKLPGDSVLENVVRGTFLTN
jgi:hypothetical protein